MGHFNPSYEFEQRLNIYFPNHGLILHKHYKLPDELVGFFGITSWKQLQDIINNEQQQCDVQNDESEEEKSACAERYRDHITKLEIIGDMIIEANPELYPASKLLHNRKDWKFLIVGAASSFIIDDIVWFVNEWIPLTESDRSIGFSYFAVIDDVIRKIGFPIEKFPKGWLPSPKTLLKIEKLAED